ncbi:MAG: hypothetical protein HYR85_24640 [Planctomycetes bacterium]|nr:hypothetical protein [Planctomycetota bacterium]MBI3847876.1 hypothetical protein [Planctomycetota bacterium]
MQYRAAFQAMRDFDMTQAEATAGNPSDSRGRFNCDGNFWVWEWEHNRSVADMNRLVGHATQATNGFSLSNAVVLHVQ